MSIAKYVPHQFEWKHIDPTQEITETVGKKKKTTLKTLVTEFDMRKFPFLLSDGDIIGVRVESESGADADDFQTEADAVAKEEFRVLQEKERVEKEKSKAAVNKGKRAVEHGIVFNTDF